MVFVHALAGQAVYGYRDRDITLKAGDSLSLDAELRHGFKKVVSEEFTFLTVLAEGR